MAITAPSSLSSMRDWSIAELYTEYSKLYTWLLSLEIRWYSAVSRTAAVRKVRGYLLYREFSKFSFALAKAMQDYIIRVH